MTPGQVQDYYESGANLQDFRGHGQTPEHPGEAERSKESRKKYQSYLNRRSTLVRKAIANIDDKLGDYLKYNEQNVKDRVRGKKARHAEESGKGYRGMTRSELQWTITASEEELIQRATPQIPGNKWWYH